LQRGVLPEVIVVDNEEDKDVKISAEGKKEKKNRKEYNGAIQITGNGWKKHCYLQGKLV
jgi:hypothetical protein